MSKHTIPLLWEGLRGGALFLILTLIPLTPTRADEGMWTLSNLPQAAYEKMQLEGYHLPYGQLYNDSNAIVKAVVNFGDFCSGVVVSPDGLIFTNHHCGFDAIRKHSTVEHDYMLNGFYAQSYDEELPNKDLFVSFMVSQKDITSEVLARGIRTMDRTAQDSLLNVMENEEQEKAIARDSTLRVELKPFYEGNSYYLTTYRDFDDVRLVFAIPKSMGKFGGETDNWMWPRQTCDFSVFRVYCDPKTGGPAEYSEDNVPYHPDVYAHVSRDGYKEGDFAMTMGYPGSTERYLSSYGIQLMRDCENAPRYQVRTVRQDVMLRHMRADEAVRIKYDSKYAHSANYWKNALGMNKCIDSIGIITMKQQHERLIEAFVDTLPNKTIQDGVDISQLDLKRLSALYGKLSVKQKARTIFNETFRRTSEIVSRAMQFAMGATIHGDSRTPKKQFNRFDDNSSEWDLATEKEILVALLRNYGRQALPEYIPDFYKTIGDDYEGYVDKLYNSMLMSPAPIYFNQKKVKKQIEKDAAIQMGQDLLAVQQLIMKGTQELNDSIREQERLLCAAKVRMEMDMPHYSDANFTLRMSYGQVGGYMLNGQPSGYYTDPQSLYKKMQLGNEETAGNNYNFEYFAEPVMHQLFSGNDFGSYTDPQTGTMNLCFLTNNDITGGNSGSPVFDGDNRLIGLAFDGNWDSLSADIFFDTALARCICVDIRYVLYMMDKWGKADRLINEIYNTK